MNLSGKFKFSDPCFSEPLLRLEKKFRNMSIEISAASMPLSEKTERVGKKRMKG